MDLPLLSKLKSDQNLSGGGANLFFFAKIRRKLHENEENWTGGAAADPGGTPGARPSPPTPGFEAPKLSFLGPFLIFLYFLASLHLAYNFLSYCNIFHNLNSKIFQPCFTQHNISQLMQIKSTGLSS